MPYVIEPLVKSGFNFNALFPERQSEVRQQTGLDFDLASIVKFLQKQTNNFTIDNPVAKDLDTAIYKLVQKSEEKPEATKAPEEQPAIPTKTEEEKTVEILEAVELLYPLYEEGNEEIRSAYELMKELALEAIVVKVLDGDAKLTQLQVESLLEEGKKYGINDSDLNDYFEKKSILIV